MRNSATSTPPLASEERLKQIHGPRTALLSGEEVLERTAELGAIEAQILTPIGTEPRMHS